MSNKMITDKLSKYQLSLANAKDEPILAATTVFNYDAVKVDEGLAILTTAQQLNQKQGKEYGEQYSATQAMEETRNAFNKEVYKPHLRLARKLFPSDSGIRSALFLDGTRKKAFSTWENEASQFYVHSLANPTVIEGFSTVNIDAPKLQAGLDQLNGIIRLHADQMKESGEAQHATEERDKALDEIEAWMSLYYTVAEIALADQPQYLEKLGIKA